MLYVIITNVLSVILVLGVMILIHEAGHFFAAKYFGVKVHTFSFGFGPRLFGFKRGDTDYRVSAFPLGGYVKMAGENPGDPATGAPDEFVSKPRWQRFIVGIMGPAANIILSVSLLTGLYMFRYQKPAYEEGPAKIGWVDSDSPAAKAGIQTGDVIKQIGDHQSPEWGDIELIVASSPELPLDITVDRNGQSITQSVKPTAEGRSKIGSLGWYPIMPAKLQGVQEGLAAAKAGMKAGDEIVAIDGTPVRFWPQISEIIKAKDGKMLDIQYLRDGQTLTSQMVPEMVEAKGEAQKRWRIGVEFHNEVVTKRLGFVPAMQESLATNKKFALLIFDLVGKIFKQQVSAKTLEGPIGIARLSGQAARQSFGDLISLMAAISLNLGVFNLFPIPVLDGGLLLMLIVESLMRRDLSLRIKERVTQVGFVALLMISFFVIYNDIVKSLPERFEKFLP